MNGILYSNIIKPEKDNRGIIIIIHGFLGMSDNWKTMALKYAEDNYEIHLLDVRNHGRSFHSDDFSYEIMAEDIKKYCNYHSINQAIFLGHSMGGKIAMQFATTYPKYVKKLIVADIAPKYYPPHHQVILEGLNAVDFSKNPTRTEVGEILLSFIKDEGVVQFLQKSLYRKSQNELAFRFNLEIFNKKIEEIGKELPKYALFNGETLFIKGELSNYIKEHDIEGIKEHFPNANVVSVSNAGHWLHAENPNEFYNATINFINL